MAPVLRSLSDFKRFLSEPGATIQVVRNTFIDRQPASFADAYRTKGMYEPRTIRALSKKAAIFSVQGHPTTIWLYWDKGTRKWRFHEDTVAIPLDTGLGPPDEIVYRCSYAAGYDPALHPPARRAKPKPPKPPDTLRPTPGKASPTIKSAGSSSNSAPTPMMPAQGQGRLL
ncbi:MAG: hypothetical protein JWQ05_430 [Methylobacterium sp.]|jgi:hypothetical protein|nr:hypothetical protein [Methylobacterium sp.]MDB5644761.1 hypothetical protein [Methylobacterium sp.]